MSRKGCNSIISASIRACIAFAVCALPFVFGSWEARAEHQVPTSQSVLHRPSGAAGSEQIRLAQTSTHGQCPRGYQGKYPNCVPPKPPKPKCPHGTVGKPPFCVRITINPKRPCPPGYHGWRPNCRKIITEPRPCPRGYRGHRPNCKRIVTKPPKRCKRGTYGQWPNCKRPTRKPDPEINTAKPKQPKPTRTRKRTRTERTTRIATSASVDRRPNELVVMIDRSVDQNAAFSIAQQYRLVRVQGRDINLLNARVQRYRIPDRRTVEDVLGEMRGDTRIRTSQPNYIYRLLGDATAKAKMRKRSAKAKLQYALPQLKVAQSHKLATGQGIRIAVIDSGVDARHPEFNGGIAASYNAIKHIPHKPDSHGTAVAGIIGASGDLVGIAPASQLLAVRAFSREKRQRKPLTDSFVLVHALDWAHTNRARIYNLSFAGPHDPLIEEMINAVRQAGAIVVAAAGNNGPKAKAAYPAAYPGVIAVTATDKRDRLYRKANRGDYVSIAAPGVRVFTPIPNAGYDFQSGTSFAAPHVTGVIALMLERRPTMTATEVRDALVSTARDLGKPGTDPAFGAGRINALAGLQTVVSSTSSGLARSVVSTPSSEARAQSQ